MLQCYEGVGLDINSFIKVACGTNQNNCLVNNFLLKFLFILKFDN